MTAIAVISLFAYTANAQTATSNATPGLGFVANFTIEPADDATPDLFALVPGEEFLIVDGQVNDGTNLVVTNLTKAGTATASVTTSEVGNGAQGPNSVIIQNDGINLNTVTSSTNTASLDRYTESVQTVDMDPASPTFTDSVTVYTAWATVTGEGPTGTRIFENNGADLADALQQTNDEIEFVDANNINVAAALVVDTNPITTGGSLNVGGNLRVGGIGNVESAIVANQELSGQNALGVFDNDAAITVLENFVDQTTGLNTTTQTVVGAINEVESEVVFNNDLIGNNINQIGQVQNSILGTDVGFLAADVGDTLQTESRNLVGAINENVTDIANMQDDTVVGSLASQIDENETAIEDLFDIVDSDDLEEGETGIAGTITKKADGTIHIGENSLVTGESTDINTGVITQSLSATDAGANAIDINITNGSDLRINGDLVATELYADFGDAGVTAAFTAADTNLQSQIDNNREDIDRNARGIAMVAALQHTTVLPGMTQALDLSAAIFEGETGLALNYARRINENVQINFGAASTSDFDESVIKAGIGVQW